MKLRGRISKRVHAGRPAAQAERLRRLEERLAHLEALVEGLQDAVHRDSIRHDERMAELERKTQPEAMAKALSEDARRRGI
jgi:uncharacterized coiled-coil protein SlyX